MSSLGIRFALPYVGTNGIKVVNNAIGLDPSGVGSLGALSLNENGSQNSGGSTGGDGGNVLFIGFSPVFTSGFGVQLWDNDNAFALTNLDRGISTNGDINSNTGNLYLRNDGGGQANIHFNQGKANQANLLVLPKATGSVTLNLTNYIPVTINGVSYKLLIAN